MRRVLAIALLVLGMAAAKAEAVTVKDIIDLTRAGLGDEVLLALIEVDGGVFNIDTATLTKLKKAGVSERVIEAMIRSGRVGPPEPPPVLAAQAPEPPAPQVIVIEHERPVVEQVAVPVPVYVPVLQVTHRARLRGYTVGAQPVDPSPGFGAPTPPQYQQKVRKPVYWGWGGKLRPDAWTPAGEVKDSKADSSSKRTGGKGQDRR